MSKVLTAPTTPTAEAVIVADELLKAQDVVNQIYIDDKIKDSQEIFDHKCLEMEENFDIIIRNSNEKMQNNILSA